MIFLVLWFVAIGLAVAHVSVSQLWRHPFERATVFLLHQLTVALGLAGLIVFVGHALRPAETAAKIGWPTSPNFQFELGAYGLAIAVGSWLSPIVRNRYYWLGISIAPSIFLVLAGINHIRDAIDGNLAPYNFVIIAPDLLIPASLAWILRNVFRFAPGSEDRIA